MDARLIPALLAGALATPAAAAVETLTPAGFVTTHSARVAQPPAQAWRTVVAISRWWNPAHSYSGRAGALSLQPRIGGCFCERLDDGGVDHARVVQVRRARLLRLSGAFGPLQAEALTGTLTITLTPDGAGTVIAMRYVVAGAAGFPIAKVAPAVDGMIGEQHARLVAAIR